MTPTEHLVERAQVAGFSLHQVEIDGARVYLIARWGLSRTLADDAAVVAFLDQVGAKS